MQVDGVMTFPVLVEPCEDQFAATLVGAPQLRVIGRTRQEALAALKSEISQRVGRGELLAMEIETLGPAELAGKYASDPTLSKICADAYEARDAQPRE